MKKVKYRCDCTHSLSFHNVADGMCYKMVRVPKSHTDVDYDGSAGWHREFTYEEVPCECQQYVGKTPKGYQAPKSVLERMADGSP